MSQDTTMLLHADVVAALQFMHGHPRATLLYFGLLTFPAHWTEGRCEITIGSREYNVDVLGYYLEGCSEFTVGSHAILRQKLSPATSWYGVYPLLARYLPEFYSLPSQKLEYVASDALNEIWNDILTLTQQKFHAHPKYKDLYRHRHRAFKKLLANRVLQFKAGHALSSIAARLPFLSVELQGIRVQHWIRQLQDKEVFMEELNWLERVGLLFTRATPSGMQFILTPQNSPQAISLEHPHA